MGQLAHQAPSSRGRYRAESPCPKAAIPPSQTATNRAHGAHAPLRRLSQAALSACSDGDLIAAFADEARGALKVDVVEFLTPAGASPAPAHVVATARPLALDKPRDLADLGPELAAALGARSALLVPIAWGGDVRHVAVLARRTAHTWSPDETLIAETLANQAALGLARLESERRRVAQAERDRALARAAHALNVSLELQAVLDTLAREADLAVGGAMAGVYLLDDDGSALATAGHNCPDEWFGYRLGARRGHRRPGARHRTADDDGGVRRGDDPARPRGDPGRALRRRRADVLERRAARRALDRVPRAARGDARRARRARGDRRPRGRRLPQRRGLRRRPHRREHGRAHRPAQPRRDAGPGARGDRPLRARRPAAVLRADRPRRLQARQRRARPPRGRRAAAPRRRRAARGGAAVRPGRPLRRRRVRHRAARHRGEHRPRRRRARARARPHRRPARRRRRVRQLLDRRVVMARADDGRRAARRGRPRAAAGEADRQGPRRRREPGRRRGAGAAAAGGRVAGRRRGARGRDRGARPLRAGALRAGRRPRDARRDADGDDRRRGRARRPRRAAARRRQARDPARDPAQARRARRRGVARDGRAPRDRRGHPAAAAAARADRPDRAARARALGRQRLPRRAARAADPDRLADHPRLRRLRGDDDRAPLPARAVEGRTRSRSCARARARSSIPTWSTLSWTCSAPSGSGGAAARARASAAPAW